MAKWTFEQQAAIELRHANLLISAAAGSGKTAVLVERITQIVKNKEAEIHKMLIVTYTNAAAGEMRGRIEASLSQTIEQNEGDSAYLNDQIKLLNRASIKTFHAFCLDVIRSHFQKIDCDPGFKMLGEPERTIMIRRVIEEVLEAEYEQGQSAFLDLVEAFSGNKNDEKLIALILQVYQFIQSQPHPEKWLTEVCSIYQDDTHQVRAEWRELLRASFVDKLKGAVALLEHAILLCELPGGPEVYIPTFESDIRGLERLIESSDTLEAMSVAISQFKFDRIASIKKGEKEMLDASIIIEVKDTIRDKLVKKQVFEGIKEFFSYKTIERFNAEISNLSGRIDELSRLTILFSDQFLELKKKKNFMDFNDLEHYAIKILEDDAIADSLKARFDYVFVDEYQDSSGIQEHIIQKICRGNNTFRVGDVKQSIYKFRLADPELFIGKYKSFTKLNTLITPEDIRLESFSRVNETLKSLQNEGQIHNIRIDLKKNFRTRGEILDCVNTIFRSVMSEKLGELDYDEDAMLYQGMDFKKAEMPFFEVNIISKKGLEVSEESDTESLDNEQAFLKDDFEEVLKTEELEAHAIANTIKSRIGTMIYHPKEQLFKPCQFRDIVVLIRSSKSWTPTFEQVFLEEGIPLFADSSTGYFDTLEIKMIMALLRVVDNPLQDVALLTVLRSPMVRLSIEELVRIKSGTDKKHYFYLKCLAYIAHSSEEDPLRLKLEKFFRTISDLREKSRYLPLDELVWLAIQVSTLYFYASAMPGGVSRQANLKLLVDRASALKNSKIIALNHFIEFIDKMSASSGDFGTASVISEEDNVVRLMSIHKSKGLEFPVVILCGLGRKFNFMDAQGDLIQHKKLGMGLMHVNLDLRTKSKTLTQFAIREQIKKETLSEEMRVLYVGLTRPVDQLILFATVNQYEAKRNQWSRGVDPLSLSHATGYIDWIMPALLKSDQIKLNVLDADAIGSLSLKQEQIDVKRLTVWEELVSKPEDMLNRICETSDLKAQYAEIDKRLSFEIMNEQDQMKPLKISVSDKKAEAMDEPFEYNVPVLSEMPKFMQTEGVLSAAEIGTAIHTVLEKMDIDIEPTREAIHAHIQRLITLKLISEKAGEAIDITRIQKYIESMLAERLRKAVSVYRETPFVLKMEGQYVQGVIDLYFEETDGLVLVDYKSDKVGKYTMQEISERYKIQIELYEKALSTLTQKPVKEKYIYFIDSNTLYAM